MAADAAVDRAQVGELFAHVFALLQVLGRVDEDGRQVAGDRGLEAGVVVAGHQQGDDHHHRAGRHLQPPGLRRQPGDQLAAAEQEEVEDDGAAGRIGERDREPAGGEGLRGRDGDHAGEDRPGAGRVDEAEAGAEEEPRAEPVAAAGLRRRDDPRDPGLEPRRDRRHQQRDPEAEQDGDRQVAQQVPGQPERVDHVDERHRREGEGERQAGDDPERPPPPAGHPGRERHGQHGQHARRERRRGAGQKRKSHQGNHIRGLCQPPITSPLRERAQRFRKLKRLGMFHIRCGDQASPPPDRPWRRRRRSPAIPTGGASARLRLRGLRQPGGSAGIPARRRPL